MKKAVSLLRWLLLKVDGQTYALPLAVVDRVLRMVEVTPLPGAPEVVEGVINIQGEVVPIVSNPQASRSCPAGGRGGRQPGCSACAHQATRHLAESVLGVVERPADAAVSTCDIVRGIQHIEGVLKTSDGLVLIYDLDRFFSPEEEKSLDLVQCCVLDGTNKSDGFWVRARRKPQRYPGHRADLQRRHGAKDAVLCSR